MSAQIRAGRNRLVGDPPVADAARKAADALFRGIVAASSVIGV